MKLDMRNSITKLKGFVVMLIFIMFMKICIKVIGLYRWYRWCLKIHNIYSYSSLVLYNEYSNCKMVAVTSWAWTAEILTHVNSSYLSVMLWFFMFLWNVLNMIMGFFPFLVLFVVILLPVLLVLRLIALIALLIFF